MYIVIKKKFVEKLPNKKKEPAVADSFFQLKVLLLLGCSLCCEALAAVNRLTLGGLEGHLAILTALYANSCEHFSRTLLRVLSRDTAILTSGGLVLEASRCIEFLLTCGEHEIIATFSALQCLVLVHGFFLPHLNVYKYLPLDGFQPTPL